MGLARPASNLKLGGLSAQGPGWAAARSDFLRPDGGRLLGGQDSVARCRCAGWLSITQWTSAEHSSQPRAPRACQSLILRTCHLGLTLYQVSQVHLSVHQGINLGKIKTSYCSQSNCFWYENHTSPGCFLCFNAPQAPGPAISSCLASLPSLIWSVQVTRYYKNNHKFSVSGI